MDISQHPLVVNKPNSTEKPEEENPNPVVSEERYFAKSGEQYAHFLKRVKKSKYDPEIAAYFPNGAQRLYQVTLKDDKSRGILIEYN